MNIGFLIHRKSYYKYLPPLIEEAMKRGHLVTCLHDLSSNAGTSKQYDAPDLLSIPAFKHGIPTILGWKSSEDLIALVRSQRLDSLVFLNAHPRYPDFLTLFRQKGLRPRWI